MVKRIATPKKEPKMKQKQKQQQNVIVNIGSIAKPAPKKRGRKPKPKTAPQPQQAQIITRGPTTFYQQPQAQAIQQPQPRNDINEIFRLIQQQQQAQAPASTASLIPSVSIAPPPVVETPQPQENTLEKVRRARRAKFEKPALERALEKSVLTSAEEEATGFGLEDIASKAQRDLEKAFTKPALSEVLEGHNAGIGLEDKAYQDFQKVRDLTALFRQKEQQVSMLNEPAPAPSINIHQPEAIATVETAKPSFALEEASIIATPKTKGLGLNYASVIQGRRDLLNRRPLFSAIPTVEKTNEFIEQVKGHTPAPLAPLKTSKAPFFVSEKEPLSLLNVIEQSNLDPNPEILQGGEVAVGEGKDPVLAFAFPDDERRVASASSANKSSLSFLLPDEPPPQEEATGITELNLGQAEELPPPPTAEEEVYQGGEFLPAIIQPKEEASTIKQLLGPKVEPSLLGAAAAEEVRQADVYTTEQLVKGKPEGEIDISQYTGTPTQKLIAFVQDLNKQIKTIKGDAYTKKDNIKYSHSNYEEMIRNIQTKKGPDFFIPDFTVEAKQRGRPKGKATKEDVEITNL
jgi:hypothetical protein